MSFRDLCGETLAHIKGQLTQKKKEKKKKIKVVFTSAAHPAW